MKTTALAAAAFVSLAAIGAANANSTDATESPQTEAARADESTRVAEGWRFWEREGHGERDGHRRRHHQWREDDDDDDDGREGRKHRSRGDANRPADPNSANATVPDNGVFNGKSRPQVEVK
jgi:hypothetical protein